MFRWYALNSLSGHEKKAKSNLEQRIHSLNAGQWFRRVVIPTESTVETKRGQKVQVDKHILPGYILVSMDLNDESWTVVKNTPGIISFVGSGGEAMPLAQVEVNRLLGVSAEATTKHRPEVAFALGDQVKVVAGPLADFSGEVVDVNPEQVKLKVMVNIFERQVPVELAFDQVRKI
jgi:transcriptional antiterminator NusG